MIDDVIFNSITEKQQFARSVKVTKTLINNLDTITDLNLKDKSDFKRNDSEKFCGRDYYNSMCWFGIRDFSTCRLSIGFLELYQYKNIPIQTKLALAGFKYDIVDTPIDKGHWYYINFESICCFKDDEDRKLEIEEIIKDIMEDR